MIHGEGYVCKAIDQDHKIGNEKGHRADLFSYLVASYLCSTQFDLKPSRCSSCSGGFSHFR